MPHNGKHYQKLLRTHKFVVKMVLAVLFVLGAGLSLMWLFDRLGGSFMSRGWQVFFIIVFAFLVAGLQIPGYIMDIRKIDMDNLSPAQPQTPKPYAAILEQARKEDLIDEDNRLQVPRSDFVRFIVKNGYFKSYRKENWKAIDKVLKDWRTGVPISADQLTQTYQDLQGRGQL